MYNNFTKKNHLKHKTKTNQVIYSCKKFKTLEQCLHEYLIIKLPNCNRIIKKQQIHFYKYTSSISINDLSMQKLNSISTSV